MTAAAQVAGFGALGARMGVKFSAEELGVAGEAADGPVAPGGGEGVDGPVAPGCGELGSVGLTAGGSLPRWGAGLLHCPLQEGGGPCGGHGWGVDGGGGRGGGRRAGGARGRGGGRRAGGSGGRGGGIGGAHGWGFTSAVGIRPASLPHAARTRSMWPESMRCCTAARIASASSGWSLA